MACFLKKVNPDVYRGRIQRDFDTADAVSAAKFKSLHELN